MSTEARKLDPKIIVSVVLTVIGFGSPWIGGYDPATGFEFMASVAAFGGWLLIVCLTWSQNWRKKMWLVIEAPFVGYWPALFGLLMFHCVTTGDCL